MQQFYLLGPTSLIRRFKDNRHIVETRVFHKTLEKVDAKQSNANAVVPIDT